MDISPNESKDNKNVNSGVQVLNKIISLNHQPITILVPNNDNNSNNNNNIKEEPNNQRKKIPRPANAFMIFANENRRKVAKMHPLESNKEISIRLGTQWKNLSPSSKDKYFAMAKEVDDDHKRKYPDYVYNPKEARIRKALRDRERSIVNSSTARSRRSNWSRQSPAPQMPPIAHGDPHMNVPSKEFRSVIRHELEHGFLHNNGGYIYPTQQYLFAPQSEYMSYINAIPSSNWPGNTYNNNNNNNNMQNNNMVQQQIWNQYQADRVRSQQNQNYVLNAQSDYQMEHMPPNNTNVQMVPTPAPTPTPIATPAATTSKSRMQQNIENAASDVDRYLNIPNAPRNNIQLDQMPIQMMANVNATNDDSIISATAAPTSSRTASQPASQSALGTASSTATCTSTSSISNESNQRSIDMNGSQESTSNNDVNISVSSISDADGSINLDNSDNAESGFVGGMQLFNGGGRGGDVSLLNNTTTDNRTNKGFINQDCIKQEPCTSSSSILNNLHIPVHVPIPIPAPITNAPPTMAKTTDLYKSMVPNPYFQMELLQTNTNKQFVRSFLPSNTYFIELPNTEPQIIKKQEIPLNYSAQKYYESVSNGNFDVPIMPNDQYGGFVCDDGYSFVILNQADIQAPNYSYLPNQLEVNQFLTDPCDMIPVNMDTKNDDDVDCILDLSKEAESEQEIDVGEENCSLDKFMDVSNRICEELSKIS